MSPFKATHQLLQLFLSGMLLILILPSHVVTALTCPANTSIASCPQCNRSTPLHRLLVGVEVLKTYRENISSLRSNTSKQVTSDFLDLASKLEILHAFTESLNHSESQSLGVDHNLSELIRQNAKDAREWLRFIYGDDVNVTKAYLENITNTDFETDARIQAALSGKCSDPPDFAIFQTMWIYSNCENLSNINCPSLYGQNNCTNGSAAVTGGTCYICRECINSIVS